MSAIPLTIRVLSEIEEAPGSSAELADCLGLHWKDVAGCLSNMCRGQKYVKVAGRKPVARGRAFIYEITAAGKLRLERYRSIHQQAQA